MLADESKQICKDYGCLVKDEQLGGVALRATLIIDDKGILRHKSVTDIPVERDINEIFKLVQSFQSASEIG